MKQKSIFKFVFSPVYEGIIAELKDIKLSDEDIKNGRDLAGQAQKVWDKYEKKVLHLFAQIYKIEIDDNYQRIHLTRLLDNHFSSPLTISVRNWPEFATNLYQEKVFMSFVVHELAHYFAYSRPKEAFINTVWKKYREKLGVNDLESLHIVIHAVEFTILAELYGSEAALKFRENRMSKSPKEEYRNSVKYLTSYNVPLDVTCIEVLNKLV